MSGRYRVSLAIIKLLAPGVLWWGPVPEQQLVVSVGGVIVGAISRSAQTQAGGGNRAATNIA